ncbi:DUF4855 domain-containing protein [Heliophilum fasciatum]|uniref:F5/8 type C domain-containing protein n=1 Tax=Heliophilum fasciatum TaxID=35700 RepID=A0A4R2S124_9FIRM|nr:DUF4855 domain-containing protein [Heliophilum fasciatum]MCW2276712.1 hypothetical protein [Heliophilum fasciatum]TCP68907.1 F5/8 type C domain-containing protein [Heliophilum fasciatum]
MINRKRPPRCWRPILLAGLCLLALFPYTAHGASLPASPPPDATAVAEELATHGISRGIIDYAYPLEAPVTRAQLAALLARTAGIQPLPPTSRYRDVLWSHPCAGYIEALSVRQPASVPPKDFFAPEAPATYEDAALFLDQLLSLASRRTGSAESAFWFADRSLAPASLDAVNRVLPLQLLGVPADRFMPRHRVTHGQALLIAQRLLARQAGDIKSDVQLEPARLTGNAATAQTIQLQALSPEAAATVNAYARSYGIDNDRAGWLQNDQFYAQSSSEAAQVTVNVGTRTWTVPVEPATVEASRATSAPFFRVSGPTYLPVSSSVTTLGPIDPAFFDLEKTNHPGPYGGVHSASDQWTGFYRMHGRALITDLGQLQLINAVSLQFQQDTASGVYLPKEMQVDFSQDGLLWSRAGKVIPAPSASTAVTERTFRLTVPTVAARYVRVSFPVDIWVFARRLQIEGPPNGAATPVSSLNFAPSPALSGTVITTRSSSAPPDQPSTAHRQPIDNLLLVYTDHSSVYEPWSQADFLPMLAHKKSDQTYADRFFDGMLLLPHPDSASFGKKAWDSYAAALERQLTVLDEAVAWHQTHTTGFPQTPLPVVLTIHYPTPKHKDWPTETARLQSIRAFMAKLQQRWQQASWSHLRHVGYYWLWEDVRLAEDQALIRTIADDLHKQNLLFYWIPYYDAPGLTKWRELGFDQVYLQPNYYFDPDFSRTRLLNAYRQAQALGLGIEIEGTAQFLQDSDFRQRYLDQLIDPPAPTMPYAFYLETKSLVQASQSNELVNRLYHATYRWMQKRVLNKAD